MLRVAAVVLFWSAWLGQVVYGSDFAYTISTFAGSDWVGDGSPATQAILLQPQGIALDARGNIYVSDASGHRVRQVTPAGVIHTVAGTGVRGSSGDGGPATSAQLNSPYGLVLDPSGNLYIADLGNGRVRRVGIDGRITTVAATPLSTPRNLALDSAGALYISDFDGDRVYKLLPGGSLDPVAGTGVRGYSGEGGLAVDARLNAPAAVGIDPRDNTLYIGDTGNHMLRKVRRGLITSASPLVSATGLIVDAVGTIILTDPNAGLIYRFSTNGPTALRVIARDIAVAADGSYYTTDTTVVRRIQASGIVSLIAGGGNPAYGDRGDARSARLSHPSGVTADSAGNVYVADRDNHRIRKISRDGVITTVAGTGIAGDSGDGGLAVQAQVNKPSSVTVDAAGNLYIADTGNRRVRRVTPQGQMLPVWAGNTPVYAIVDGGGALFVVDLDKIIRVTAGISTVIVENLRAPQGLALDKNGNLYCTDAGAARVWRIGPGLQVTEIATGAWSIPRGIAVDDAGNIYVADTGRQQIVRADDSGVAVAIAGSGITGFSGDGDAATIAQLGFPWDVAVGPEGKLYIADLDNNRIRALAPATLISPSEVRLADAINAASGWAGPIAPGMLVAIRGSGLTPGDIPDAQFRFAGISAPFVAFGNDRILVQAPEALPVSGSFKIDVLRKGIPWIQILGVAAPAAPGLFTASFGQAAASNEDGSANSVDNPAKQGSVIAVYGTGLGTGSVPVSVNISGQNAEILYAGPSGALPGIFQLNIRVPPRAPGPNSIVVTIGDAASQPGLILFVGGVRY